MELKIKEAGHAGGIVRWIVEDSFGKHFGDTMFLGHDMAEALVKIMTRAHGVGYRQAQEDIRGALGIGSSLGR